MNTKINTPDKEQIRVSLLQLVSAVAPEADFEHLDANANLTEALDIDSFDFLNVLIGLEEQWGITVPEADYGQLISLNDIIDYVVVRL